MDTTKTQGSGVGNAVYGGLATYGKINAIIGSVIAGIIVLGLLIIGVKLIMTKDTQTTKIEGTVSNVVVKQSGNMTTTTYSVNYSVDGKNYAIEGSGNSASNGQTLNLLYDPANPSSARLASSMSNHTLGRILILIGVVIGLLSALTLYFTLKYKEFAAIEGGMAAAGQIGNLIRG